MGNSAADPLALAVGAALAVVIVAVLAFAMRRDSMRQGWIAAAGLFVGLSAIGAVDLARHAPRETPFSTVLVGVAVPVLGTLALLRGMHRVRPWIRWPIAFVAAFALVFAGFLLGATLAPYLPF